MPAPLISVIMPVYNGAPYLAEAVDSILAQTLGDFELLIIDDASTDETPRILATYRDPRLHVTRNAENLGLTRNLNRAITMARGRFIARQDADDCSHSQRFARQIEFLQAHPEVAVLGTQCRIIDEKGAARGHAAARPLSGDAVRWTSILENPFIHSTVMMTAEAVRDVGGYNEVFHTSQDAELWSRLLRIRDGANLPDILLDFRIHGESISKTYTPHQIARVADMIAGNLAYYLGLRDDVWLADWVWVHNPALWRTQSCANPRGLIDGLGQIKQGFVARLQDRSGLAEIELQYHAALKRIVQNLALSGDPGLWTAATALLRQTPGVAVTTLPGCVARRIRLAMSAA